MMLNLEYPIDLFTMLSHGILTYVPKTLQSKSIRGTRIEVLFFYFLQGQQKDRQRTYPCVLNIPAKNCSDVYLSCLAYYHHTLTLLPCHFVVWTVFGRCVLKLFLFYLTSPRDSHEERFWFIHSKRNGPPGFNCYPQSMSNNVNTWLGPKVYLPYFLV